MKVATKKIAIVNDKTDFFSEAYPELSDIDVSKHLHSSDVFISLLESILGKNLLNMTLIVFRSIRTRN